MVKFFGASLRPPTLGTYFYGCLPTKITTSNNYILRVLVNDEISNSSIVGFACFFFPVECYLVVFHCFAFSHSLYLSFFFFSFGNNADWCTFWTIIHSSSLFSLLRLRSLIDFYLRFHFPKTCMKKNFFKAIPPESCQLGHPQNFCPSLLVGPYFFMLFVCFVYLYQIFFLQLLKKAMVERFETKG